MVGYVVEYKEYIKEWYKQVYYITLIDAENNDIQGIEV